MSRIAGLEQGLGGNTSGLRTSTPLSAMWVPPRISNGGGWTALNPVRKASTISLYNSSLSAVGVDFGAYNWQYVQAVKGRNTGKWYFEVTIGAINEGIGVGLCNGSMDLGPLGDTVPGTAMQFGYFTVDGTVYDNITDPGTPSLEATISSSGPGQIIACSVDLDSNTMRFEVLGGSGSLLSLPSSLSNAVVYPSFGVSSNDVLTVNFGQSSFVGSVPIGYSPGWEN